MGWLRAGCGLGSSTPGERENLMRKRAPLLAMACLLALVVAAGAGAATVTPVAAGLDSPRGLAFLPDGTLAVAEAGHGGDVCFPGGGPCLGTSGQISTIDLGDGSHTPIVSGLF